MVGNADLANALNRASFQRSRVEVVNWPIVTSDAVMDVTDCYIDLEETTNKIQKLAY